MIFKSEYLLIPDRDYIEQVVDEYISKMETEYKSIEDEEEVIRLKMDHK